MADVVAVAPFIDSEMMLMMMTENALQPSWSLRNTNLGFPAEEDISEN